MEKLSVRSLLCASAAAMLGTAAFAQEAPRLKPEDLEKPEIVKAWLLENQSKADKAAAQKFLEFGQQLKKEKRWAPATKAFGDAAIRYPTPQAINEHAEMIIRDLKTRVDPKFIVPLYRSALAADSVLHLLSEEEKKATQHNADCLETYAKTKKVQSNCPPLQAYGLSK